MLATELLTNTLANFLQIYFFLILVRVLLTWFPTADWAEKAMSFLSPITDPYLNLFRSVIPPMGGIDFSPILAIFVLQFVASLLGGGSF